MCHLAFHTKQPYFKAELTSALAMRAVAALIDRYRSTCFGIAAQASSHANEI